MARGALEPLYSVVSLGACQRPDLAAVKAMSRRMLRMATAASESGIWSDTQTETVSSIFGLEMALITEREGVAIWQATDQGRMVEPVPSATASRSVPSDSTSATILAVWRMLANAASTARRTKLS